MASTEQNHGDNCDKEESICFYEQESDVYLRFGGILESATGTTGTPQIKIFTISRDYRIAADNDVLVVSRPGVIGEIRFSSALIVLSPQIRPCRRNNGCKQIIRYFEQAAFVDIGDVETIQFQVCDIIAASDGLIYLLSGVFDDCNCEDDLLQRAADRTRLVAANLPGFPSAPEFLVHLRRSLAAPAPDV
ncbi:Hypothetical protein HVR_LOCUS107 [uncultured virus]|nr:Hypothetical protein HVR_LOCUS107 [uncultured virus]